MHTLLKYEQKLKGLFFSDSPCSQTEAAVCTYSFVSLGDDGVFTVWQQLQHHHSTLKHT